MFFTYRDYVEMAKEYRIKLKSQWTPPCLPTWYAEVRSRLDDSVVMYLWLDAARERWIAFSAEEGEEIEELFAA